ncbi:MAG: hypothetical protein JAZ02_17685 [Candidatus Thiodiazotropha endolucinida]|nr:hypothetical protein [Candidatus Thiodiazotropha endolucinida]
MIAIEYRHHAGDVIGIQARLGRDLCVPVDDREQALQIRIRTMPCTIRCRPAKPGLRWRSTRPATVDR